MPKTWKLDIWKCPNCPAPKGTACRVATCPQLGFAPAGELNDLNEETRVVLDSLLKLDAAKTALEYMDLGIGLETEMAVWLRVRSLHERLSSAVPVNKIT